jgi:hypothetical protein
MDGSQALVLANLPNLSQRIYEPIDSENGEIRLIELLPAQYDDVIQLNFYVNILNDDPVYDALSYAWGTTDSSRRAIVNGCPVPVRESLDLGLRRLRFLDQPRMLWIDALSINQDDNQERSHQVQHMARIYKSARKVVIWLGEWPESSMCPNSDGCQAAWTQVLNISADYSASIYHKHGRFREVLTSSSHFVSHIIDICELPWFRRLWIIQEFVLASCSPEMLLGQFVIDSIPLFLILRWGISVFPENPEATEHGSLLWTRIVLLECLRDEKSHSPGLFQCMAMSRSAAVTNPKDRVYSARARNARIRVMPDEPTSACLQT